jgi:hypothetical protein
MVVRGRRKYDLTGQRFEKLAVLSPAHCGSWNCVCDCGKKVIVETYVLRIGGKKSCGCMKYIGFKIKNTASNLVGKKFEKLTVIHYIGNSKWKCLCDCGCETIADTYTLKHGGKKSCGCLKKEVMKKAIKASTTHGMTGTPEYNSYFGMKERCFNQNSPDYSRYGGRGITVCERWLRKDGFTNFLLDVGLKPSPEMSIHRVNNDGNYEPTNCIWATPKEQGTNRRDRCQKK